MDWYQVKVFGAGVAAVAVAGLAYVRFAPPRYDITEPIDLTDRPTFVTELKLRIASPEACFGALKSAGIEFERLPNQVKGERCEFRDVALLEQSLISWGGDVTLRCPMLAGLAMWERHSLQPLAREVFDSEVVRIRHYGTYSCRNINNAERGQRSEHATANAVDVAGFVLRNGEEISVLKDWGKNTDKGWFLRRARNRACDRFNTVLGPDYNTLHSDHFHFDNGGFSVCR